MSAGGAFGGNRGLRPVPPEKGVFPLDHLHECDLSQVQPVGTQIAVHPADNFHPVIWPHHEYHLVQKSATSTHQDKKEYISCLKSSGYQSERCRHFSKKYLECRMERNLMAKQDMSELGFGKEHDAEASDERNIKLTMDGPTSSQGGKTIAT